MINIETFLVRHGSYDFSSGNLDMAGVNNSILALEVLTQRGLGETALVLSSDKPRALETAAIINQGLGALLVSSHRINIAGNNADGVDNLDEWLMRAIVEENQTLEGRESLVVVAHEPLLKIAKYNTRNTHDQHIDYGEVIEYKPGSWVNRDFSIIKAEYVESKLKAA